MVSYLKHLFVYTWSNTEKASIENNSTFNPQFVNKSVVFILVYIAFGLSVVRYFGNTDSLFLNFIHNNKSGFGKWFFTIFYIQDNGPFYQKLWWVSTIALIYIIIPCTLIKLVFKRKLKDYGVRFKGFYKDYPLYILMLAFMWPIVYFASRTSSFQERYPIFKPAHGQLFPIFIWWQIAYFIQFVAVEFFFRGFILHGLKNRFGFYAIFVSMVPYCMVHFGKPFGETIAAIIAGIVLGTLSLKSRSIVLGILIHYSVAITMDLFALYREGLFH